MLPLVVCGGAVGVLVNLMFAPAYLTLTLTFLLLALTWQSALKMMEIYRKETKLLKETTKVCPIETLATIHPIVKYNKEQLEKEKYLPDIRYMRSEDGKLHDWAKEESSDDESYLSDQPNNQMDSLLDKLDTNDKGLQEPLIH